MAIIHFATSLADYHEGSAPIPSVNAETNAGRLAPYVSEGIQFPDFYGAAGFDFAPQSDFWHSFHYYTSESSMGTYVAYQVSGDGNPLFRIISSTSENFSLQYWTGSTWTTIATTGYIPNTLWRFDIRYTIADTGGAIEFWQNGTLVGSITGDTKFTTQATADRVDYYGFMSFDVAVISASFISTEDSRAIEYQQLLPNGAGSNSGWTGAYTDVDEIGINDADRLTSSAAGQVSTFALTDVNAALATGHDVIALGVSARGQRGSLSSGYLIPCCYQGGTLGEGASKRLDIPALPTQKIFSTNPATGTAWTVANLNSAEAGVKSASA